MNKLFTKIAALALGATMAVGVGVAVASSGKAAESVSAAGEELAFHFQGSSVQGSETGYAAREADVSSATTSKVNSAHWQITVGNSSAQLGTNAKSNNLSKTTLGNGSFSAASGIASALGIQTTTTKYSAAICTTGMSNITKGELIFTGTNGGNITTAWLLSSTDGSTWTIESSKTSSITTGSTFTVTKSSTAKQFAFVCYWNLTNSGGLKGFEYKLYGEYEETQTITVDPSSKEAYTDETFSLTTNATSASWALSNNTCGASLSAASGKTVTVSATGAGSVRVTASASGYTSPYVDLTFSERPTSPYVTPEKSSTNGYTGLNETLSFAYGNLTSTLGVVSSNTSVVTVETPSYSAGEGTVKINFVGAGSTTVKFNDGSTELASVSVSVTASSVTITGLAASDSVYIGKTLDLGSTITVTATGIYSSDVTWESDDDSIATVSTTGVVTGVAEGTVDITVTSDDYPSATMTCAVTVETAPISDLLRTPSTSLNYTSSSYGDVSGITKTGHSDITSEATYAGHFMCATSPRAGAIQLNPSKSTFICTTASSQYLNSIAITFNDANGKGVKFYASNTAYTATYNAEGSASSTLLHTSTSSDSFTVSGDYKYLYIVPTGTTYVDSIKVTWKAAPELSSVTTSGQTTSFTAGVKFSYGGTLTAHYTAGKADATVSPAYFKYGASGINPTTAGTTITTAVTMEVGEHSGKYIYVVYTEDDITKWASYQITVNYAPVTSVVIDTHAAEIGLNETYDYTLVGVTINTEYADQGYEWIVHANTVGDDYTFDGSGLKSKDTEGTITLWCRSTADNSKYDELVVTVTGDPTAEFVKASTSGYVGKSELIEFTYGNIDDVSKITVASSNTSYVTVANDLVADEGEGLVTINFVGAGSTTVTISYDGGETLDTLPVTVSADSVVSVSWNASNFDVFSGTTLTSEIDNTWLASYEMASGDEDLITYGEYTLKLGGTAITLPHTWVAADDGKTLCIEYGGVSSSTVSVAVTQTINSVLAPVPGEQVTSTLSFTEKYATGGATSSGGEEWTVESDGTESNFDDTKGIHYGTGSAAVQYIKLTTSDFASGTITSVVVNASTASGVSATASVTVGGNAFGGDAQSLSSSAADYTFTDEADAGEIVVTITKPSSATKAIYCKSIVVTYSTESGETVNIANNASHKAAQRVAVAFAQAFNAAMDDTENCTTGLDAAWSTCSSAYDTFKSAAAALGETEEAWAKNLVKYATVQWSDDSGEACIERMMKTYEVCVQKHGKNAFMSDLVTLGRASNTNPITIIGNKSDVNVIAIVVITSVVSLTAIGGYFFLRKRKENI